MAAALPSRPRRLRADLTGAGWTYLGLAPLLAATALIEERAALLAGLWAALGMAHVLLARLNFRGLRLRLECAETRSREGRGFPLDLLLERRFNPLAAQALCVRLRLPGRYFGQSVTITSRVRRGRLTRQRVTIVPPRFGLLFIHAAEVSSAYPFGLYRLTAEWLPPPAASIAVWPRLSRIPARGAGQHEVLAAQATASVQPGVDIRPYAPGDPMALVCWKSTARTGRMHVRPRENIALGARQLIVSTQRESWSPVQFRTMLALACALLEEGYRRRTIAALWLDEKRFALTDGSAFAEAMDALCTARARRLPGSASAAVPRHSIIVLRPFGRHAVRALTEKGAVLSHVA